jgi:hypothetical protein
MHSKVILDCSTHPSSVVESFDPIPIVGHPLLLILPTSSPVILENCAQHKRARMN